MFHELAATAYSSLAHPSSVCRAMLICSEINWRRSETCFGIKGPNLDQTRDDHFSREDLGGFESPPCVSRSAFCTVSDLLEGILTAGQKSTLLFPRVCSPSNGYFLLQNAPL
mmetsp:Transcript_64517/g.172791  ORF Transcript_64517/g.172791 Transcript_64517/m.172791 type:complete len:112 (+) Transcript_64517:1019-1354(+)